MATSRSLPKGEIIFLEGDTGDSAYLIRSGRVLVYLDKAGVEVPLKMLGEGEVFGEMSLIDGSLRSASCRAVEDTALTVVTKDQLLERIKTSDAVVQLLVNAFLERLRSQNQMLRGNVVAQPPTEIPAAKGMVPSMGAAIQRIELENRIADALVNDEFLPYYQPIYDLETREVVGCEALIRWINGKGELISPVVFMDLMEGSTLINRAGQMMIEKSMRDLPTMLRAFPQRPDFFVSVNVSGRQFADPGFVAHLERARQNCGIEAHHVKLEITERIMMEGPQAIASLEACRQLGYRLAIDDFGTGFSSMQYLSQMPLTDLKIDRSFIVRMEKDEKGLAIVKSLIYTAALMGLDIIAEGLETETQAQQIRNLGVKMGQGYNFAKPMPLADFVRVSAVHAKVESVA